MVINIYHEYPVYDIDTTFIGIIKLNKDLENKEFIKIPISYIEYHPRDMNFQKKLDHITQYETRFRSIILQKHEINKKKRVNDILFGISYYEVDLLKEPRALIKSFLPALDYVPTSLRKIYFSQSKLSSTGIAVQRQL